MWFWSSVNYDKQEAILKFINLDLHSPMPPLQRDAGARSAAKFDGVFEAASWAVLVACAQRATVLMSLSLVRSGY